MKKLTIIATLLLTPLSVFAAGIINYASGDTPSGYEGTGVISPQPDQGVSANADQSQLSYSGASNQGNAQQIVQNSAPVPTNTSITTVGNAGSAFLTTSDGTCQGSQSLSAGWLGAAAAEGSTYTVLPCNNRMNALVVGSQGERDTAIQIMCADATVYNARLALGKPCYIKPNLATVAIPGGMPFATGSIDKFAPTAPVAAALVQPNPDYMTRQEVNSKLDALQRKAMLK